MRSIRVFGDPVLRKKAKAIEKITPEIELLSQEMIALMIREDAVGLAANQIGILKRIFVMREEVKKEGEYHFLKPEVIINPILFNPSKEEEEDFEGCLSLPSVHLRVSRPKSIKIKYQTLNGDVVEKTLRGFKARIAMHETDHLNGILIIDKS